MKRIPQLTTNSDRYGQVQSFVIQLILIAIGLFCIVFSDKVTLALPYITGGGMLLFSVFSLLRSLKEREYTCLETRATASSIISAVLAVVILAYGHDTLYLIAVLWGLNGLSKGISGLNVALYNKSHGNPFFLELLHAFLETALAILLVINPFHSIREHIIILGVEIVLTTLKYFFRDQLYTKD